MNITWELEDIRRAIKDAVIKRMKALKMVEESHQEEMILIQQRYNKLNQEQDWSEFLSCAINE